MINCITIGEMKKEALKYYTKNGRKSSFKSILSLCMTKKKNKSKLSFEDCTPMSYLSLDDFWSFIEQIPLGPSRKEDNRAEAVNSFPSHFGNFYICENEMFDYLDDITAYIHIPYIGDGIHTHDHFEINYVYHGEAILKFEEETTHLSEGSFIILAPNSPHNIMTENDALVISIMIRKTTFDKVFFPFLKCDDTLSSFFKKTLYSISSPNYLLYETSNPLNLSNYFQNLLIEYNRNDVLRNANAISILSLIFSTILRQNQEPRIFYNFSDLENNHFNFYILMQYIYQNYQTVSLNSLSREFNYSASFFSKLILKKTGKQFSEIVQEIKLKHGLELLQQSQFTIQKISEMIGYASPNHFSRIFKKVYGVSPQNYRKNLYSL